MFGLAAFMGWMVVRGLDRGETRLPVKGSSSSHVVSRQQKPVQFWVSIGLYTVVGAGLLTFGLLGAREWRRNG